MKIKIEMETELNRAWIWDEEADDIVGETNFVVPTKWLSDLFEKHFAEQKTITGHPMYHSFDDFIDVYEPEEEGEFIYTKAIEDGVLKEDLGVVMY